MPDELRSGQTFLEKFVAKHYARQPRWVRTTVYLIFALLLALTSYRLVAGEYSVRGRILQQTEGGFTPARMYEIQLGDRFFGTNSKGFYYLVLGPAEYYRLLATRELELEISSDATIFPSQSVRFSRVRGQLADIKLGAVGEVGWRGSGSRPARSMLDLLAPPLWAQGVPGGDRLFLRSIRLTAAASPTEARLAFEANGRSQPLLSARTKGPAGLIPVVRGEAILFEAEYYFPLSGDPGAAPRGQVRLTAAPGKMFTQAITRGYSESFQVAAIPPYGRALTVTGDRGSEMTLAPMSPYDVTMYEKEDLAAVRDRLKEDQTNRGFRVVEAHSPLSYRGQTNALFGGKSVPFTALQEVLRVARARGVRIKTIQYRLDLRSKNPYEIQLGGSAAFNQRPAIPATTVTAILAAKTEEEFQRLIRPRP